MAAPFATSRLADAGARVIKVERPEGDFARLYDRHVAGECAWFVWLNRGKESVVLDIKNDADNALLHRIVARADVFVQNLAPGRRHGRASIRTRCARGIPASSPATSAAMARAGPTPQMKAYDFLIQCESGIASVTGTPESASRVGVSVCDIGAGLNAYGAILEAVLARHRTGRGSGHPGLALRRHGGLDDRAAAAPGARRQGARADGPQPRHDRALRRLSRGLRRADGDRDPERARVGALLRGDPGRCGAGRRTRASPATRPGSPTEPRWTR